MRTFLPEKRSLLALAVAFSVGAAARPAAGKDFWNRPAGRLALEFGIDSLERKFYRPELSFTIPLAFDGRCRAFADLSFWQRLNGRLEGPVDFWLAAGLEHRFSNRLSVEASLSHFCRHLTSIPNPYVLNLNEVVGRVWVSGGSVLAGFGLGTYIGGSPGYDALALFNLRLPGLLLDELAVEAELKWVNFDEILYAMGLSLELAPATELFLKTVKTYAFDATAYLGLRFLSSSREAHHLASFGFSAGVYPYYDRHKLLVLGNWRLAFLQESGRRFFLDAEFRSPILGGRSFWGEFWPDRMTCDLSAEYEKRIRGLRASWYGRYFVDLPVDKAAAFRASFATGLALRNQADFDRLEKAIRWELRAGWDFKFDYDLGGKIGLNTVGAKFAEAGCEFRLRANRELSEAEFLAFLEFGEDVAVRPFLGLRKIAVLAGEPLSPDPFRRKLIAGLSLFKWFD